MYPAKSKYCRLGGRCSSGFAGSRLSVWALNERYVRRVSGMSAVPTVRACQKGRVVVKT